MQDLGEQCSGDGDFCELECDVAAMSHDLRADLDELLPKRRQRPVLNLLRQRQRAQEVAEIVGERVELQANRIVAEAVAGKPCPVDRVLTFLDPLLGCTPSIIKLRHPCSRSRQVGDDEADARIEFTRMPLNLGHNTPGLAPGRCLIGEARAFSDLGFGFDSFGSLRPLDAFPEVLDTGQILLRVVSLG